MKRIILLAAPVLLVSASLARAQSPQPAITLPQAQYFVDTWYRQFLGRLPDPGAAVWILGLVNGRPAGDVLADILASREFFTLAGGTNAGFVARLYQTQLGRAPTPAELLFWTNILLNRSRKFVALQFLISQGNIAIAQIPNQRRRR
ncbi:MAG TPA: DUF4214 domain-containing protein [Gemmataceae bacterium]|jgi:hypothetical protein